MDNTLEVTGEGNAPRVEHTPGPWLASTGEKISRIYGAPPYNASQIAEIKMGFLPSAYAVTEANVRLIAAAPELLAQLKAIAIQLESANLIVPLGVTKAIDKAEGRAE